MANDTIKIGNVEILHLSDGMLEFDLCNFFPTIPGESWRDYESHLTAEHKGKKEAVVRWVETTTADPYGIVDFNQVIGKNMSVAAYAYTVVESPTERPVQLRAGSFNAVKMFLNGKQVFFREEYHHGMKVDQHIGTGTLKAGKNEILIKVCQNEQKDEWAQSWSFQLRLTDALGGAVPFKLETSKTKARTAEGKVQP